MRIVKPSWVHHDGMGIYSIDCHPAGQKFATAGQGKGGVGHMVIWNLTAVLQEDDKLSRALFKVDTYQCINVVRWSKSGKYVATAGDERVVVIWQYHGVGRSGGNISGGAANLETWKSVSHLKGHNGDILHAEWSPNDRYLASCSVDNTIVIWNGKTLGEKVATLSSHADMVKGLTWDPTGRYIASQASDKTIKIWATSTWDCVKSISKPFQECSNTTHVLRLGWSPDGDNLTSSHAMNNGGPVALLIDRKGWNSNRDLVGHRKAITCVRYNTHLFEKEVKYKKGPRLEVGPTFAMGSRDRSVSVWQPKMYKRPIVVLHRLFSQGVLDLSWSADGRNLLGCSSDGSICCITFSSKELGRSLSPQETETHIEKLYGSNPFKVGEEEEEMGGPMKSSISIVDDPAVLLAQEARRNRLKENATPGTSADPTPVAPCAPSAAVLGPTPTATAAPSGPTKQVETRTKDGKRRIQPLFLGGNPPAAESSNLNGADSNSCTQPTAQPARTVEPTTFNSIQSLGDMESLKRKAPDALADLKRLRLAQQSYGDIPITVATSSFSLPIPEKQTALTSSVTIMVGVKSQTFTVSVENEVKISNSLRVAKLKCWKEKSLSWEITISCQIVHVAGTKNMWCVSGRDGSLRVLSATSGRLLCSPLVLDGPTSVLSANDWNLLAITSKGSCSVWDMEKKKVSVSKVSVASLVGENGSSKIASGSLSKSGQPIITMSDGRAYSYSSSLDAWILLAEAEEVFPNSAGSGLSMVEQAGPTGPLASLSLRRSKKVLGRNDSVLESLAGASLLETRVEAALSLNSLEEYQFWLTRYMRQLIRIGAKEKIREICGQLLKDELIPSGGSPPARSSKELLAEFLPAIAENPALQSVYSQLKAETDSRVAPSSF